MAQIRCPICGEKYDETYRDCPFCEEEEALEKGVQIRRNTRKPGRRAARRQMNILTPTLGILILIMAALLVYLLFGDTIAEKLGRGDPSDVQVEEPVGEQGQPGEDTPDPGVTAPEVEDPTPAVTMSYETAVALPSGLQLSTTDFSLFNPGEKHTIKVTGGNGVYQWFSENPAVATVSEAGEVMALTRGTIQVVVTDGEKQGICIVRCNLSGSAAAPVQPTPSAPEESTPSGLQAGNGKVVNAGGGVRVRAEANTSSEILATLTNGSQVKIVESAGNGWYKINFANSGGVNTTGYMKGEYLANR